MDIKSLPPRIEPFFPDIFYKTQLCERQAGLPPGLQLTGKVAMITGANALRSRLGFETSKQLLALNLSHLIFAVRTPEEGEKAAGQFHIASPKARIEDFAKRVDEDLQRLDIVLLNAGLVKPSFQLVKETGHEESMQVNYLSTVCLALLLLPALRNKRASPSQPGKLTIGNSGLSLTGKLPLNSKKPEQPIVKSFDDSAKFSNTTWYNTSKTLMHMFLWKLSDYVTSEDVVINLVDPGYVKGTEAVSDLPAITALMASEFAAVTGRTVEVGASTYVGAVAVKARRVMHASSRAGGSIRQSPVMRKMVYLLISVR
ncbi:hypothetical protein LTR49_013260 [Elasticomyces elasticus]|nr:hypothetical protein LTR49_013260 [Elasticomyces elasticus]